MEICVLNETCVVFVLTTILSGVYVMGPFRLVYFWTLCKTACQSSLCKTTYEDTIFVSENLWIDIKAYLVA